MYTNVCYKDVLGKLTLHVRYFDKKYNFVKYSYPHISFNKYFNIFVQLHWPVLGYTTKPELLQIVFLIFYFLNKNVVPKKSLRSVRMNYQSNVSKRDQKRSKNK